MKAANCGCGCGAAVSPGREYRQGHDAKHKSALLNAAVGPDARAAAKARQAIAGRGWDGHLAIREAMIAKKTARKSGGKAAGAKPAAPARKAKAPAAPANAAGSDGRVPDLRLASERTPEVAGS
jgi:hypothetical protein